MADLGERVAASRRRAARGKPRRTLGIRWRQWGGGDYAEASREQEALDAERQQRKIAYGLLYDPVAALNNHDVPISRDERRTVLEKMRDGEIGEAEERNFLGMIKSPAHQVGVEGIYANGIMGQKHQQRILAYMTGTGFDNYQAASVYDVQNFLQKFPMPMDFDKASDAFLDMIAAAGNSKQKVAEYVGAMDQFKATMYGKRQEYWDQMKAMEQEAVNVTVRLDGGERRRSRDETMVEEMQPGERAEFMRRVRLEGDPWGLANTAPDQRYQLYPEHLERNGLAPEFVANVEDLRVGYSKIFRVCGHDAVIGYVQTEDGDVRARGYYRSGSQGMWRYLPDYAFKDNGNTWWGKGYSEESLTLPPQMQQQLERLAGSRDGKMSLEEMRAKMTTSPEFLFEGTAKRYDTQSEYLDRLNSHTMRGDFYKEVATKPVIEFGHQRYGYKSEPEKLDVAGEMAPDFSHQTDNWRMNTGIYGQVQAECYDSADGRLNYMFCQNGRGEAWLGTIQTRGKLTSFGCRKDWVEGGDLATPLYEYSVQSSGYGGEPIPGTHYVNMWQKYMSKMPIIQKYMRSKRG